MSKLDPLCYGTGDLSGLRNDSPAVRFLADSANDCDLTKLVNDLLSAGMIDTARKIEHDWAVLRCSVMAGSDRLRFRKLGSDTLDLLPF